MILLKTTQRSILCLLAVVTATGCSMGGSKTEGWKFSKALDVRRAVGLKKDELAEPQTPTRLVSTWTEAVLNRQGEKPQRGFGGRLLFFNNDSDDPVRVEGQLVVYAYDDAGREDHETQPTRRYVFPREQFTRHESESKLGPSYSFWLPWDAVGGEQKNIDLIARFEPQNGPLIVGEQTRHLLPGSRQLASGETAPTTEQVSEVRLAQYSKSSELQKPVTQTAAQISSLQNTAGKTNKPLQATSISLSKSSWGRRLTGTQGANTGSYAQGAITAEAPQAMVDPGPAVR